MRRFNSASVLRASLAPLVVVGLAGCGGGGGGGGADDPGEFFEDVLEDAGFDDGGDDDGGDDGGDGDGGGDDAGGGNGPPIDYVTDAVNTEAGGEAAQFNGATGRWRSDISGTILGAARVLEVGAESMNLRFDGGSTGNYSCGTDALISYNARADDGSPLLYSTRPEGASCTVVVEAYDEVGGRIRGWFDATLLEAGGSALDMVGAFDVERLADQ